MNRILIIGILSLLFGKLQGQTKYNPDTYKEGLKMKFPNNTKLIKAIEPDTQNNDSQLIDNDGNLLTSEKLISATYIKDNTYEVVAWKSKKEEKGLFVIGKGIDWTIQTPSEKYLSEISKFRQIFSKKSSYLEGKCFYAYPRIIDYLTTRHSVESGIMLDIITNKFFVIIKDEKVNNQYDSNTEGISIFKCKVCESNYKVTFYRFGEEFKVLKNIANKIGADIPLQVPNYTTYLEEDLFCKPSIFVDKPYFKSDLNSLITYLFKKR
jgi:hypothetical protein